MAKVVDIERVRVDRLAAELLPAIRDAFSGSGIYKVSTAEIADIERWRREAPAGSVLRTTSRRVGTDSVSNDGESVWIVDESPATDAERAGTKDALDRILRERLPDEGIVRRSRSWSRGRTMSVRRRAPSAS